jgi:hypothetical protein
MKIIIDTCDNENNVDDEALQMQLLITNDVGICLIGIHDVKKIFL